MTKIKNLENRNKYKLNKILIFLIYKTLPNLTVLSAKIFIGIYTHSPLVSILPTDSRTKIIR